jgi:hypothetical protein
MGRSLSLRRHSSTTGLILVIIAEKLL